MLVRVDLTPTGPRVHVLGRRVHHWEFGALLMAVGGWLVFDDRRDLPRRVAPVGFNPVIGWTTDTDPPW